MKRTSFSPSNGALYIEHIKNRKKYDMVQQHYHDAYEIYLQLDGRRYAFYDNICYTLSRGDLAIFRPFEIHYFESRDSNYYERYAVNFSIDGFSGILTPEEKNMLEEKLNPCVVHLEEEQIQTLYDCFERVDISSKKTGFLSKSLTGAALLQLVSCVTEYIDGKTAIGDKTVEPQIIAALQYMNKNYMKAIGLDDIAAAARVSKYYFCRRFRETTGATAFEYLDNVRLTRVHNLLLNTTMTLEEIAYDTGFSSAINLSRVFKKKYGMSPRNFRKKSG